MPEQTRRGGAAAGGFWIRRVGSPAGMGPRRPARAAAAESNKENAAVRPTWRGSRARKSPLPEWYPRTPLRDITAIVNVLERRRRLLMQAAMVAQANRDSEGSPQNALLVSPSSQEPSVSIQALPIDSTPCLAPTCLASFDSPIEHPLQMSCASSSSSPTDDSPPQTSSISSDNLTTPRSTQQAANEEKLCSSIDQIDSPPQTSSISSDNLTTPRSTQQAANEEKLCSSIDQIEKIVTGNLKKTRKKEPAAKRETQRRTLMSMR